MMKLALLMKGIASLSTGGEVLECEVEPLEEYGFTQFSQFDEYVCVSPTDYTDFIIIGDEEKTIELGDDMTVLLNDHGEVMAQVKKD